MAIEVRAAYRLARAALHVLWGVAIVALLFPRISEPRRLTFKARWSRELLAVFGARLAIEGAPPAQGLLVANHISWLDILAINAVSPTTFLSKDDVLEWPVIGWLAARVGTVFLERGSRAAAQRAKERLVAELRGGRVVGVFPEGTTGFGDLVMPFHAALFQSAIDAGVNVVPALVRYTDALGAPTRAAAYVGETSLWECMGNIARTSGLTVRVDFLPTVATVGIDRRHLAHHTHGLISHALTKLVPGPIPSRAAPPGAHTATGTRGDPPAEPPSGSHPIDSRNPAPADSSPA
jgi:1-acyl-sn-glycerol-3-phosphate acyltransferase